MARPDDRVNSTHMLTLDDAWDVLVVLDEWRDQRCQIWIRGGDVSTLAEIPSMPPEPERRKATPQYPLRRPGMPSSTPGGVGWPIP